MLPLKSVAIAPLTPLQYQKQLRLLEARRLMISCAANVETASFEVGYESASQFSREYARMFGNSPKRDATAMHQALQQNRNASHIKMEEQDVNV